MDHELSRYVEDHTSPEGELLYRINRETNLEVLKPRMISGHLQGRVLAMLSQMISPKYILEVGTYTGYSALCLAEGMKKDGRLITIDINDELAERTKGYFCESHYEKQIDFRIGNALDIIPQLHNDWDLVFIDADKENYSNYFNLVIEKMNSGSYLIADNVLWSGKVIEKYRKKLDMDTEAIIRFNKKVNEDTRVENLLLPVRDGLMIVRKI